MWECPNCKTMNHLYNYECTTCEHKRYDLVGKDAAKYVDKTIPKLHNDFDKLIDDFYYQLSELEWNLNYLKESQYNMEKPKDSPKINKLKETIDLLNFAISDLNDFYHTEIYSAYSHWEVTKEWMHEPTENHILSKYILPLKNCRDGLDIFILRFEEISRRRCRIGKLVNKLKSLSLRIDLVVEQLEKFDNENRKSNHTKNDDINQINRVEYLVIDAIFDIWDELCVYREDENIICRHELIESGDGKYCEYIVEKNTWKNFLNELILENNIMRMSQEEFEDYDINNYIHDDLSYKLKIILDRNQFEYNGWTSSYGVQKIRWIFDKYFSPPKDIEYNRYKIESMW